MAIELHSNNLLTSTTLSPLTTNPLLLGETNIPKLDWPYGPSGARAAGPGRHGPGPGGPHAFKDYGSRRGRPGQEVMEDQPSIGNYREDLVSEPHIEIFPVNLNLDSDRAATARLRLAAPGRRWQRSQLEPFSGPTLCDAKSPFNWISGLLAEM